MQVQNVSFINNSNNQLELRSKYSSSVSTPKFRGEEISPPQKNKNNNKKRKEALFALGLLAGAIAAINHKKIGALFKKKPDIVPEVKPEVKNTPSPTSAPKSSSYSNSGHSSTSSSNSGSSPRVSGGSKTETPTKKTATDGIKNTEPTANTKPEVIVTEDDIQGVLNKAMGGTPEEIAQRIKDGDAIAAARADEIANKVKSFPELIVHKDELWDIAQKNKVKWKNQQLDLDYYKDEFRAYTTISVDRLNNLRKSTNPKLKEMFDLDRNNFTISSGIMIHGSDRPEKKALLNHFVSEAEKHGMKVIRLEAGDSDPHLFAQQIAKLFPEAKKRFREEKIATMFVMEDMDKMLNLKDPKLSAAGSVVRGQINRNADKCGEDGVIWVSTIKDLKQIDPSCYDGGGGRVRHVIDIDKVAQISK